MAIKMDLRTYEAREREQKYYSDQLKQALNKMNFDCEPFKNLFESLPFGIFIKDKKGDILDCNEAFLKMNGLKKSEILGSKWKDQAVIPQEAIEKYFENDQEVMRTGRIKRIRERLAVNDTQVETWKIPYIGDNGEIQGVIGFSIIRGDFNGILEASA